MEEEDRFLRDRDGHRNEFKETVSSRRSKTSDKGEKKSVFSSRASLGITAVSTILQGGVPGPEVVG